MTRPETGTDADATTARSLILIAITAILSFSLQASAASEADFTVIRDTLPNGKALYAELPRERMPTDYTPRGFIRQPSFVRGSGVVNRNEHALLLYMDADVGWEGEQPDWHQDDICGFQRYY